MVVGALADVVEDQFARLFADLGIGPVSFLPPRRSTELPAVGAGHPLSPRPALPRRDRARARSARRDAPPRALSRSAWRARRPGSRPRPMRFARIGRDVPSGHTAPGAERARVGARTPPRRGWPASASSSSPIRSSRSPLARFLSRELGMELVEVGTPYLHREHLEQELALLPAGTRSERRPGRRSPARPLPRGTARPRRLRPRPRQPARGRRASPRNGRSNSSSRPIQGYEQAGDLAELFARPLARRERLEV